MKEEAHSILPVSVLRGACHLPGMIDELFNQLEFGFN